MIPGISEKILGGMFSPDAGHANPQRTVQAFAWAFQDLGGRLYQNTAVTGIKVVGGRVSSVETTAGAIKAEVVVGAAGPQTGLLAEMVGVHVPGGPGKGGDTGDRPIAAAIRYRPCGERTIRTPGREGQSAFWRRTPRMDRRGPDR